MARVVVFRRACVTGETQGEDGTCDPTGERVMQMGGGVRWLEGWKRMARTAPATPRVSE